MPLTRRGVALLLAMSVVVGAPALAAGCGDDDAVTDPPIEQPQSVDQTEGSGADQSEGSGADEIETSGDDETENSGVIDATDENLEYPFYECADVDGDGIPDGPWDCNNNNIPDEDEDGGFLP
jgi:hypothetical protein